MCHKIYTLFKLVLTYIEVRENLPHNVGHHSVQHHNVQPDIIIGVAPSNFELVNIPTMAKAICFSSNIINTSTLTTCESPNGMRYRILPVEIILASPTFYQLGEHMMIINGMIGGVKFDTRVHVFVESDTSELLSGDCMSVIENTLSLLLHDLYC